MQGKRRTYYHTYENGEESIILDVNCVCLQQERREGRVKQIEIFQKALAADMN